MNLVFYFNFQVCYVQNETGSKDPDHLSNLGSQSTMVRMFTGILKIIANSQKYDFLPIVCDKPLKHGCFHVMELHF